MTWNQAKEFSCRPSDLVGIESDLWAYYFDRAVFTFGRAIETELDKAGRSSGKKKKTDAQIEMARNSIMAKWLGLRRFADPTKRG